MVTKIQRSKHQKLVDIIYEQLEQKPWVKDVFKNFEYQFGELDILYINNNDDLRYIEVKSNHTKKGKKKARSQFNTFKTKFPLDNYRTKKNGIYYSPQTGFKRYHDRL